MNTSCKSKFLIMSMMIFLVVVGLSACSRKFTFRESAIVPAAQGNVKIKKDKNENYAIDLSVRHLSPPERLVESRNAYVVWAKTERNGLKNLGQLKSSRRLF